MFITSHAVSGRVVCPGSGGQHLQERAPGLAEFLHLIVRAQKQQSVSGDQLHDSVSGVSAVQAVKDLRLCSGSLAWPGHTAG